MAINQPKTASFYEGSRGWPSFHSFIPDSIISLNNRLFTFKYGDIWEHNISPNASNPVGSPIPILSGTLAPDTNNNNVETLNINFSVIAPIPNEEITYVVNVGGASISFSGSDVVFFEASGIPPITVIWRITRFTLERGPATNFTTFFGADTTLTESLSSNRNEFYRVGSLNDFTDDDLDVSESKPSVIEFVFNEENSIIKSFKAFSFEGDGTWDLEMSSDQESESIDNFSFPPERTTSGEINSDDWVTREGKKFAYLRGVNADTLDRIDLEHHTIQGVGQANVNNTARTLTFSSPVTNDISVGDSLFFFRNTAAGLQKESNPIYAENILFAGAVQSISSDRRTITYRIDMYGTDSAGNNVVFPDGYLRTDSMNNRVPYDADDFDFFLFSKDRVGDTSSVIGFYATVKMTNTNNNERSELYAVNAEVTGSPS